MNEAIATILVAGAVQITGMVIGFLTLWLKMKTAGGLAAEAASKASVVETKIDHNTEQIKLNSVMTKKIEQQTNGGLDEKFNKLAEHTTRIEVLEAKVEKVTAILDNHDKNLTSTRHELRGHLQVITNKLDLLNVRSAPNSALKIEDKV